MDEDPDLSDLVIAVQAICNPRVAFVLTEEGTVHFASSVHPHEAADALEHMASHVRRNNCNHARTSHARSRAHLN